MIQTLFGSLDEEQKPSFLDRMKEAVTRTRENLSERIEEVVSFGKEIDRTRWTILKPRFSGLTWERLRLMKSWKNSARRPTASRSGMWTNSSGCSKKKFSPS